MHTVALALLLTIPGQWDTRPSAPVNTTAGWNVRPVAMSAPIVQKPKRPVINADILLSNMTKEQKPQATGDAAHTPLTEVARVISMLPKPKKGFVDFGCGYDARWCIAAAEQWPDVPVFGVEIDPGRAKAARERAYNLGLRNVTILEGDAGEVEFLVNDQTIKPDVGVAYLYPELLERLQPRLADLTVFVSYLHQPGSMPVTRSGDSYFYWKTNHMKPQPVQVASAQVNNRSATTNGVVWQGQVYTQRVCQSPNCQMCNYIQYYSR